MLDNRWGPGRLDDPNGLDGHNEPTFVRLGRHENLTMSGRHNESNRSDRHDKSEKPGRSDDLEGSAWPGLMTWTSPRLGQVLDLDKAFLPYGLFWP